MTDIPEGARIFSQSELKKFRRCRRSWWLGVHRQLKTKVERVHGPASHGNRVHQFLETYYKQNFGTALAELYNNADRDRLLYPEQAADIIKDVALAEIMVEGYVEWAAEEGEDEDLELVEPEATVVVPLETSRGTVYLVGKLDQRFRRISTGELMFRDFKNVPDFSRVKELELDTQMKHYMTLLRLATGEECGAAMYTMLRRVKRTARSKPPFYMNLEVRHNIHVLRTYYRQVVQEVEDILELEGYLREGAPPESSCYPNPTRDCSWDCPFRGVCAHFDDPTADAEGLTALLFDTGDYLSRYSETHPAGETEGINA